MNLPNCEESETLRLHRSLARTGEFLMEKITKQTEESLAKSNNVYPMKIEPPRFLDSDMQVNFTLPLEEDPRRFWVESEEIMDEKQPNPDPNKMANSFIQAFLSRNVNDDEFLQQVQPPIFEGVDPNEFSRVGKEEEPVEEK